MGILGNRRLRSFRVLSSQGNRRQNGLDTLHWLPNLLSHTTTRGLLFHIWGMTEGVVIASFTRVPPIVGGGSSTCKRKKEKQVAEHHKTHKYIASEKDGSKQKKAQTEECHTTSSPDD